MSIQYNCLASTLLALVVAGCGGGSSPPSLQAGQPFIASVLVDGVETSSRTYNIYSVVDEDGTLSDQSLSPDEERQLSHVWILASARSSQGTVMPQMTVAQYKACYHDFWQSIRQQMPGRTTGQIVQRLHDFDMTIDELCDRQVESGLSVDEYVELFRVVARYWPNNPDIDGKIARFFTDLKITPRDFKQTLGGLGHTWDDFVQRMAAVDGGGHQFINEYRQSGMAFEPFLGAYMLGLESTAERQQEKPLMAVAGAADLIETVNEVFSISKTAWQFMRDNQGVIESFKGEASARIVSAADPGELNYAYAQASQSPVVSFVGKSFLFGAWETYRTDLQLSVDYGATHQAFGGQWMPDLRVLVKKAVAPWGYQMAGDVVLSSVVNRGSAEEPIPEVQVDVVMSVKCFSTVNQTLTFKANGASGAAFVP